MNQDKSSLKKILELSSISFGKSVESIVGIILIYFFIYYVTFFTFPHYESEYNQEILKYILRIMTVLIPTSIAIFTFAFKETKETAYISLKTSNIKLPFIILNVSAVFTLLSCILLIWEDPEAVFQNHFRITVLHSIFTIGLFIFYIVKLISSMDLVRGMNFSIKEAKKAISFLESSYTDNNLFTNRQYSFVFKQFSNYNEAIFHTFNQLIERGHYRKLVEYEQDLSEINKNFIDLFINTTEKEKLITFINESNVDSDRITNQYNNILLNYRLIIRNATKHKLTKIQNDLIKDKFQAGPEALLDINKVVMFEDSEFVRLSEGVVNNYFSSSFELITELCEEDTVEFSYLMDMISTCTDNLSILIDNENGNPLFRNYYENLLQLLQSITLWSMESKKLYHLTESINLLLLIKDVLVGRKENIEYKEEESIEKYKSLIEKLPASVRKNISNNSKVIVQLTKSTTQHEKKIKQDTEPYLNDLLSIIFRTLLKSVEIGHYNSTGYLIKILCSYFKNDVEKFYPEFYENTLKYKNTFYNADYYHYSINTHSAKYCLDKLIIIISAQWHYKAGTYGLIKFMGQQIDKKDIEFYIKKINAAGTSYGLLCVNPSNLENIKNYYYHEKLKLSLE